MPNTCRSEEPFYEPSVDASTVAEGRHSTCQCTGIRGTLDCTTYIVYTRMYHYLHDVHYSFLSCDMLLRTYMYFKYCLTSQASF